VLFPLLAHFDISTASDTFKLISLITGSLTSVVLYTVSPVFYVLLHREKDIASAFD
jgi:hypothetical protein